MPLPKTNILFDLAKELTCDLKFPLLFAFIIETITHGQIVSIVLSPGTTFSNDSTLSWFETIRTILLIPSVFGTVNIQDYPGTIQSFWIVFVVYLICYLLSVIGIVVLSTMYQRKPWLSQSLTILSLIHSRVFFLPIHYFLLQVIQYVQNDTAEKDNANTFITGIGIFIATILLILINLILACLKEFLCYRIDRDKSNYCSKTNLYPRLALMYKVLATTILVSTSETTVTSQVISITGIIYTGAIIYILSSKLPFYDLTLLQFSHALASATMAFSIFGFLSSLSQVTNKSVLILLVTIVFLVVFFHNRLKVGFERILTAHFDTAERAIHFPILFKKYASNFDTLVSVRKSFPLESLYFYNFFTANIYTSEELKNFKAIDLMNQEFYSQIIDRCSATRINYKKSEAFLLYMANILINKLGNTFQALTFMEEAKQAHSSIPVRVSADNLYNSLSRVFEKNMDQSSGDVVLSSYFKHRDDLNLLKTDIRTEIKHHQDLWSEIAQDKVDVKKVIDLADKIDHVHLKIAKQWARKELDFQRTYSGALMMYSFYLDILKGFPHDSIPLIRKYYTTTKNSINKKEEVISEDSVIMIASMERDKLGTVTDCSDSVLSMFGIARERLLNAKINILMPNFISAQHDKFMQRYMQSSTAQGTERKYYTFGKSRDGSLKEIELELKVYPHLDKGVNMIAYIKQLSAQSQIMIIKPDGQIAECSINLQKVLKLNSSFIENVNIKEVCPDFVKINTAFNVHFGNNEAGIQEDLTQTNFDPRDTGFNKKTDQPLNSLMEGTVGITKTKEEEQLLLFSPTSPLMSPQLTSTNAKIPLVKENSYPLNLARDQSYPLKLSGYGMMAKLTATDISIKPLLNEDEAKNVVEKYRDGDQVQFLPYSTAAAKRVGVSFNISVTPYILDRKVYKIIRLLDIEGLEDKNFKIQEDRSPIIRNNRGLDLLGKGILGYLSSAAEESHISSEVEHDVPEERSFERSETRQTDVTPVKPVKPVEPQRTEAPEIKREEQHIIGNIKEDMEMKKLLNELGSFLQGEKQKQGEDQMEEVKKRVQTMMIKQSIQGSSTASLTNMNLKLIKRLNDVFNVKKTRPITRWATFAVYMVLIAIFTFAFVNLSITQPSLERINDGVAIIDTSSRRLNRALVAWEWMLMFYSRLLGLRAFFSVYGYSRKYIFNVTTTMMQLDKSLRLEIESINNNEIRDIFLEKGIKFYDAKGVLMYPGINMDTFGATDNIIIQNRFIGNYSGLDSVLVKRPEFITSINNTANGLLVASESIIKRTYDALQLIVKNSISQSKEILIFEHIGLLLLCLALTILVRVTLQAYSKVFQAITRISPSSIKSRQDQIKSFEDMLDNNMEMQTDIQRPAKAKFEVKIKKDKDKKKKTSGHFMKTYRMAGLTLHLSKYIIISVCLMAIISGMFLALYLQSQSSFTSLGKASTQIYTIGKLNYQGVVVLANFYFVIIFQNYTNMYIRNQDPLVQLDINLASLSTVNEQLLAAFSNVDDPTVYGLLNGNLCSYLASDQQSDCSIATQGGSIALLGINSRSYSTAANYINLYKANPTTENAKQLIKPYYDLGVSLDRTTDASFTILANYILVKFNTEVTKLKESNLLLSYGVAIVIVITTILMHSFSIKKFITLDMGQRKILKALTYNVVSQNKALGFLLKKEFKNEVQGLGRVLSV